MQRLTERIDNVPDGESGVWVKNHDYISAAIKLAEYEDLGGIRLHTCKTKYYIILSGLRIYYD